MLIEQFRHSLTVTRFGGFLLAKPSRSKLLRMLLQFYLGCDRMEVFELVVTVRAGVNIALGIEREELLEDLITDLALALIVAKRCIERALQLNQLASLEVVVDFHVLRASFALALRQNLTHR